MPLSQSNRKSEKLSQRTKKSGALLGGWPYRITLLLTTLLCYGLLRLPLVRDGDYEFSQLLTFWVFPASSFLALYSSRRNASITHTLVLNQAIIAIGLLFLFMVGCECDASRSFSFFFLLPFTACIIGALTGRLAWDAGGKHPYVLLSAVLVVSLLVQFLWVIFFVPISAYSVFWGFFAGPIYDTWIPIEGKLIWHRVWSLSWPVFLLGMWHVFKKKGGMRWVWLSGGSGAVLAVSYFIGGDPGFTTTYGSLREKFSRTATSGEMRVFADSSASGRDVFTLVKVADFYAGMIGRALALDKTPPADIYVYQGARQKKLLFGAGPTNFAKIWNREIHVNAGDASRVLKHEMVHIISTRFGSRWYGTARVGLLEGVAEALSWDDDLFTPHEWSAALLAKHKLPAIRGLIDGDTFFSGSSSLSYTVTGSFVRFLVDSVASDGVIRMFDGESFESAFSMSFDKAETRWQAFLSSMAVDSTQLALVDLLLQPGVLQRRCVHAVSDFMDASRVAADSGDYDKALKQVAQAIEIDPANVHLVLYRIRLELASGVVETVNLDSLAGFYQNAFGFLTQIRLLQADLEFIARNRAEANRLLDSPQFSFGSDGIQRAVRYRRYLYAQPRQTAVDSLLRFGASIDKIIALGDTSAEGALWEAEAAYGEEKFTVCLDLLMKRGPPKDAWLSSRRLQILADSYFWVDQLDDAIETGAKLLVTPLSRAQRERWKEKTQFWKWLKESRS